VRSPAMPPVFRRRASRGTGSSNRAAWANIFITELRDLSAREQVYHRTVTSSEQPPAKRGTSALVLST
jgi:hypothetical protein